ncbi:tetraspanin-32 isoform X3 [Phyllostomus discolor]|uniref:Tetraspanin-32 isoform X3 n=1 Tax=Phyllostomus discolor TaxID=89673 RepID=A0A7E6E2H2_9CHIR|nr:tetraspanin-32 isoform X3 [Phyllostomus discolor]
MGPWSRVRVAKCQMLVTSFFVLLLGLLLAAVAALARFGAHFAVLQRVSPEGSPYQALHRWAFLTGISLAGLLGLGAVLSAAAAVREARRLMAAGFLCFALAFCALAQVAFWRLRNPTQVEDTALDTYDLAYDRAVRSPPGAWRQELQAIQDTDCLQGIRSFLRMHGQVISILASVGLASMVYAMLLSSFLWFAICSGRSLDRRGTYALSPRARGQQPREPSFFRRFEGGLAPALHQLDDLGPSGRSGSPWLLQDH